MRTKSVKYIQNPYYVQRAVLVPRHEEGLKYEFQSKFEFKAHLNEVKHTKFPFFVQGNVLKKYIKNHFS